MTPEQIGEYLEHQGATDDEIDEFLEHFGVKGMRWGQRKATPSSNSNGPGRMTKSNLRKRRLGIAGGALLGGAVAGRLLPMSAAAVVAGAVAGGVATNKILQKHGSKKVSELPKG